MSVDEEYHAHKRREKALYVFAFDEFEKKLMLDQRRSLGSAAVPDVEEPLSHSSRRVSLGVLTDALNASKKLLFQSVANFLQQHLGACWDGRFSTCGRRGAFDLVDDFHQSENTRRYDEKFDNLVDE